MDSRYTYAWFFLRGMVGILVGTRCVETVDVDGNRKSKAALCVTTTYTE